MCRYALFSQARSHIHIICIYLAQVAIYVHDLLLMCVANVRAKVMMYMLVCGINFSLMHMHFYYILLMVVGYII